MLEDVTYDIYCNALDGVISGKLDEGLFDTIKGLNVTRSLIKVFKDLKSTLEGLAKQFKLGLNDIVIAFKQREIFNLLKAVGFNIKILFKSVMAFSDAVHDGLLSIFKEIAETGVIKKIKSGAMKIDDVLNKYPKLKKIGGIVIAGLLIYIWLNMTFIGNFNYDFNFTDISGALTGSYSITTLFTSPSGIMLLSLFASGSLLGLSIPWLGVSLYNFILAVTYTGFIKAKDKYPDVRAKVMDLKKKIKAKTMKY